MNKEFVVIGLGRFGSSVTKTLASLNAEVLAIDINEQKINAIAPYATHAAAADATDEDVLNALGIRNIENAIVCIGDIQSSIMVTLLCKEMGMKFVLVKAKNELHAKVLKKIGADKIVFPERDTGIRVANQLISSSIMDFIEISSSYGLVEFAAPRSWIGKTLAELNPRSKYDINVIALKHGEDAIDVNPRGDDVINQNDIVIVIGKDEDIKKIKTD